MAVCKRYLGVLLASGALVSGAGWAQDATQGASTVTLVKTDADGKVIAQQVLFRAAADFSAQLASFQNQGYVQVAARAGGYGGTGAAAASGGNRWHLWGGASYNRTGNSFQPAQTSGNIGILMGGVDYRLLDNLILGVAMTAERSRLNLEFVTGGGNISGDGYSVAPYFGYAINRSWSLDGSLGYGVTKYDISGGGATGNFRGTRSLGSLGVNYRYEGLGSRWVVTGRGALTTGTTRLGSFTLSNGAFVDSGSSTFNQLRLGGQVAYAAGSVTPYVGLTYVYDIKRQDVITVGGQSSASDRDAWVPVFGLRFTGAGSAYGSLQLSSERGRSQIRNDQLLFNLGVRF